MKNIIIPIFLLVAVLIGCNTPQKEHIQETFYGCSFGDSRLDVEDTIKSLGFNIDYTDSGLTIVKGNFEFCGQTFSRINFGFHNNKFTTIMFYDGYNDAESAKARTEYIYSKIKDEYAFQELPKIENELIYYEACDDICSCVVICDYDTTTEKDMSYWAMLAFQNNTLINAK